MTWDPSEKPRREKVWSPKSGDWSLPRARKWASNFPDIFALILAALKVFAPLLTEFPMNFPILLRFLAEKRSEKLDVLDKTGARLSVAWLIAMFSSSVWFLASHRTVYKGTPFDLHSSMRYLHDDSMSPASLRNPETQIIT